LIGILKGELLDHFRKEVIFFLLILLALFLILRFFLLLGSSLLDLLRDAFFAEGLSTHEYNWLREMLLAQALLHELVLLRKHHLWHLDFL